MQDQPVMRLFFEFCWNHFVQPSFYGKHGGASRQPRTICHPENVSVDRNSGKAKGCIQDDIRCFSADARQ